jgi:acetylornithine deacetylase
MYLDEVSDEPFMNLFELTRALIDIDSVTPHELEIGNFFFEYLRPLAEKHGGRIERNEVAPGRNNVFVAWGKPEVVFSTHMDTVPPFIRSREDEEYIWGRGSCDTHGIAASMIKAIEALLEQGIGDLGLLLVIGEEIDGLGAMHANQNPPGAKYLINGEPTENKLGTASKGSLRLELEARGKAAHSAYVELGDSAIDKLLDNLQALRALELPVDPVLGPSTLNIGTISGGEAGNIIASHAAASVVIRVVSDLEKLQRLALGALDDRVEVRIATATPAIHLKSLPGFSTEVVKYTTDIPKLTQWGEPLLLGPGSIHVAHTPEERISKKQMLEAVELYQKLVKQLKNSAAAA